MPLQVGGRRPPYSKATAVALDVHSGGRHDVKKSASEGMPGVEMLQSKPVCASTIGQMLEKSGSSGGLATGRNQRLAKEDMRPTISQAPEHGDLCQS